MELELNINELLPPELLLQVLNQLPPSSLLSAVLVCRLWHDLAHQTTQLWAWVHLTGQYQVLSVNPLWHALAHQATQIWAWVHLTGRSQSTCLLLF